MLIVAALTAIGVALRLAVAQQSLFADELSTRYVVAGRGLGDVISLVHTDAEITPPLSFVASWLTTRIAVEPELLRAPSLIAGAATIPLVYLLGVRTVGRGAALVAAAFTTFSPFMVYYSAEARGYALLIALVLGSTLALLAAVESGRARWWALYAVCACAAVYTHYTGVFALAGQLAWALWAHPAARRPALLASAAAAIGFLPWLSGLRGDLDSATTDILSALQPFDLPFVRSSLAHWAIGFPYATPSTRVADLPGVPALIVLGLAIAIALAARLRRPLWPPGRGVVLLVVLAAATPVGEAIASLLGDNVLGTRNLAASWPAFALCLAALLVAAGRRLGPVTAALAIVAFAAGGLRLLDPDFRRPDYDAAAAFIERRAAPGDVVVDGVSVSPAGLPTALDVALAGGPRVLPLGRDEVRYDPFRIVALAPPPEDVVRRAASAAAGGRVFFVIPPGRRDVFAALPPGSRRVTTRGYRGINRIEVVVVEPQTTSGA
jgi:Dolichyl-phosphate-mannose-protein mannosyltransferase